MMKVRVGVFAAAVVAAVSVQAKTWQVSMGTPDEQGLTGVDALTNAIARAAGGDTVEIGSGTYDLSGLQTVSVTNSGALASWGTAFAPDGNGLSSVFFNKKLIFKGADETSWRGQVDENGKRTTQTILKGTAGMRIFYGYTGSGRTSGFYNLTFVGGQTESGKNGGAIVFAGTEGVLVPTCQATNCVFRGCSAPNGTGGATFDVNCRDCLFEDNSASKGGAAFGTFQNNEACTNDFFNCEFVRNSATGSGGGAIYAEEQGKIIGCVFSNNTASVGGAIQVGKRGVSSVVSNCTFIANKSTSSEVGKNGGAIGNSSVIYGSTFIDNESKGGGGAVDGASPVYSSVFVGNKGTSGGATLYSTILEDCHFTNNTATSGNGGACRLGDGGIVRRCTFVGNTASCGGALYMKTTGAVEDSSFVGNRVNAGNNGGAIYSEQSATVTRCDFADNHTGGAGGAIACGTSLGEIKGCTFLNSSSVGYGGCLYGASFGGTIENCTFNTSTNNLTAPPTGMHVYQANKVVGCSFTGYGDVFAKEFDRCIFDHNDYLSSSQYGSFAMIYFHSSSTGNGTVRNCLFRDCHVTRFIMGEGQSKNQIENCTFDNDAVEFSFISAMRGGTDLPALNYIRNCIFTNRSHPQALEFSTKNDFTATTTNAKATNYFYHCAFDAAAVQAGGYSCDAGVKNGVNPKFVKDDPALAALFPAYQILPDSPCRDAGEEQDWMRDATTGKDVQGNSRIFGATVDIGAYESDLTQTVYIGSTAYDSLEDALVAAGTTNRVKLYADQTLDDTSVAAERYFINGNGHSVDTSGATDAQFDAASGTLSVKVSGIYEPVGDYNIMSGDVNGFIEALKTITAHQTIVLSPGTYDFSNLAEMYYPVSNTSMRVGTSCTMDGNGKSSVAFTASQIMIKGANRVHWSQKAGAQETLLKNDGTMRIFYGYTGSGRTAGFANLSFEGGQAEAGKDGGAIVFAGTDGGWSDVFYATNCAFRNCSAPGGYGGATYDVTCKDCLFKGNTAKMGGAAYGTAANSKEAYTNDFLNCVFIDNTATGANGGGALYCDRMGRVVGCAFTNNAATAGVGGALRIVRCGAYSTLSGGSFANCTASGSGGGAYGSVAFPLADTTFANCTSTTGNGGGLFWGNTQDVVVAGCVFTNCTSIGYGCGIACNGGIAGLTNCTFVDCKMLPGQQTHGGAVYARDTPRKARLGFAVDCTFAGNSSTYGGGALFVDSIGEVARCTFTGNEATQSGGAIYCGSTIDRLTDSTFASNSVSTTVDNTGGGAVKAVTTISDVSDCLFVNNSALGTKGRGGALDVGTITKISGCLFATNSSVGLGGTILAGSFGGMVSNCVFNTSTNECFTQALAEGGGNGVTGMHIYKADKVIDCTFTGYGDVYAKYFERCIFDRNDYLVYSRYGKECVIRFDAESGSGAVRNCLFHDCHVTRFIMGDGETRNEIENCTFDNSAVEYSFVSAMRAGANMPAHNYIRNCIFTNRSHPKSYEWSTGNDFTATDTSANATNYFYHCAFDAAAVMSGGWECDAGVKNGVDPKYAKDDPSLKGKYPDYMPKRTSGAHGTGLWADWMAGAKDLAGTDMPSAAPVDMGCYQCTIRAPGMMLIFK